MQNFSPILRCNCLARKSGKLIANFTATIKMTSLPSHSLSLSLYYKKRGSTSYIVREVRSVRERERERDGSGETEVMRRKWSYHCRAKIGDEFTFPCQKFALGERDGSDVTIVALKLAMSLHFPLRHHCGAEIRNGFSLSVAKFALGDEFTLSFAKNSHFSFLPSHFPSLPS